MKRLSLILATTIVILPWLTGAIARADLIQWSVSATTVGGNVVGSLTSNPPPGPSSLLLACLGLPRMVSPPSRLNCISRMRNGDRYGG